MNLEDDELSRPIALAGALGLPSWAIFRQKKGKLGDVLFHHGRFHKMFLGLYMLVNYFRET